MIGYDDYGYQSSLDDIDAGLMEYEYNAFGELESQTDAKGNEQTLTYDVLGRALTKSWNGGEEITYVYNPVNRMIKSISSSNGTGKRFEYDELNRLQTRVDSIDNNNKFTASYSYLSTGEIGNVVLNSAVTMSYQYNAYGYVDQVRTNNQLVWDANSVNEYGIVDNFTLGNQAVTSIDYDSYGFVDEITTIKNGTYLQNWSYDFNIITGNLTSRMGLNSSGGSVTESFTYDDLNRLLTYTAGQDTLSVSYDESGYGNITGKTDVGTYDYTGGVHNVTSVTEPTELMQNLPKQFIDYTKSGKVSCITDTLATNEVRELNFIYGPDENRVKTLFTVDGAVVRTKYFALGQYEKEIDSTGNVRELYYISGADGVVAVLEKKNNQDSIFYIHKDYPGSYEVISNQNGTVKERYNFDPCFVHRSVAKAEGRRRNPADWSYNNIEETSFLDRGFPGLEHVDQFGLINMLSEAKSRSLQASGNGRVYDPLMAMFLSPDNFVQSRDLTQNLNRYTYCLNNPLKYVDPSGFVALKNWNEFWDIVNYLWDNSGVSWNSSSGYTEGSQGGGKSYDVPSGNGFQGPGFPIMLGEVTVSAKGSEKSTTINIQDKPKSHLTEFRDKIINSDIARFIIKDYYSVSIDGAVVPGFGASVSPFTVNIILRGAEKGIFLTHIPSNSLGFRGGFNISFQQGTFMGNPNFITRNSLYGRSWSLDSDFPLFPFGAWLGFDPNNQIVWRGTSSSWGISYGLSLNRSWVYPGLPK